MAKLDFATGVDENRFATASQAVARLIEFERGCMVAKSLISNRKSAAIFQGLEKRPPERRLQPGLAAPLPV
jgi:hypothetical protein